MTDGPADRALLDAARNAFGPDRPTRVAVAVSGGSDSLALLHLLAEAGLRLHAVTVDHGLRPDAAAEATHVAAAATALGVPHRVLRWEHGKVRGNLQDAARRARYGLIADWARAEGIVDIAVGHTADDVAETFLMELARGAGIDGLSAMRARWERGGLRWHRPLLAVSREALRQWLGRRGVRWIDDPTNADPRFQRVRARQALAALAPLGIGADGLAGAARRLAEAREALARAAAEAAARLAQEAGGALILDRAGFAALPADTARRLLTAALLWVAPADYPPRGAEIGRVLAAIAGGRDATLAGCRIRTEDATIRIVREPKAVAGLEGSTDALWDRRWHLSGPHRPGLSARPLGPSGLRLCADWKATGLPRDALIVSPAVWEGERLVAAPLAGRAEGWTATLARPFAASFTVH